MSETYKELSRANNERFTQRANSKGRLLGFKEKTRFFALAIAGEAGELANLIKKEWRGDYYGNETKSIEEIEENDRVHEKAVRDEIADIRIYLDHLAAHLGFDLDEACAAKVEEVAKRFH